MQVDIDFYEGQKQLDLSDYQTSKVWKVLDVSARKNMKFYPCCPEPYPDITFNVSRTLAGA